MAVLCKAHTGDSLGATGCLSLLLHYVQGRSQRPLELDFADAFLEIFCMVAAFCRRNQKLHGNSWGKLRGTPIGGMIRRSLACSCEAGRCIQKLRIDCVLRPHLDL